MRAASASRWRLLRWPGRSLRGRSREIETFEQMIGQVIRNPPPEDGMFARIVFDFDRFDRWQIGGVTNRLTNGSGVVFRRFMARINYRIAAKNDSRPRWSKRRRCEGTPRNCDWDDELP